MSKSKSNILKETVSLLIVITIIFSCKQKEGPDKSDIIGKWFIVEVSNITEDSKYFNENKLDYYFLFEKNGFFEERIFHRVRKGSWGQKGYFLNINYDVFGEKSYQITDINDTVMVIKIYDDQTEIEYVLKKRIG